MMKTEWQLVWRDILQLNAGMDVCYYNNRNKRIPQGVSVNYEIKGINKLLNILR